MTNPVIDAVHNILKRENPAADMRLVDDYIEHYSRNPKQFVLPREHAYLQHLIGAYVGKDPEFKKLARWMRDTILEKEGPTARYEAMQKFYRTLTVRHTQAERRARLAAVRNWIQEHHPALNAQQRDAWVRQIEQVWIGERQELMHGARFAAGGTLTVDAQRALLDDFWEDVDRRVAAGKFPPFRSGEL
jgi:hypothetical protein